MKLILAFVTAASLMACGGKSKQESTTSTSPETATLPEGTGGSTYGGEQPTPEPEPEQESAP